MSSNKEIINKIYRNLIKIKDIIEEANSKSIDLFAEEKKNNVIADFKEQKKLYLKNMFKASAKHCYSQAKELLLVLDSSDQKGTIADTVLSIKEMLEKDPIDFFKDNKYMKLYNNIESLNNLFKEQDSIAKSNKPKFKIPVNIPTEIRSEVVSEIEEIGKCYESGCYRAAVVLCGRLLEIALHRKYFEATNNDLLETNPNIGLGKLIAKLKEKGVEEVPGLTQQIHLINNVRITSVHKKQTNFYPSKSQCEAIILYTIDAAEQLFS